MARPRRGEASLRGEVRSTSACGDRAATVSGDHRGYLCGDPKTPSPSSLLYLLGAAPPLARQPWRGSAALCHAHGRLGAWDIEVYMHPDPLALGPRPDASRAALRRWRRGSRPRRCSAQLIRLIPLRRRLGRHGAAPAEGGVRRWEGAICNAPQQVCSTVADLESTSHTGIVTEKLHADPVTSHTSIVMY